MKQRIPIRHLAFLAICIALSLVTKRLISPVTNLLTDLIRIPGGGAATAFSLMFLAVGTAGSCWSWATTAACFVQNLISMALGFGANQGAFMILTYTLPGVAIDLLRRCYPHRKKLYFALSCAIANGVSALLTTLLVFRLEGVVFALWMLVACAAGLVAGLLGEMLFCRLLRIPQCRGIMVCEET